MIHLKPKALKAAREYAGALIDACAPSGVDPVDVLIDTEDYPKIVKRTPMIEFIVGWFRGVEDTHETTTRELWTYVSAGVEWAAKYRRPKREARVPDMPPLKPKRRAASPPRNVTSIATRTIRTSSHAPHPRSRSRPLARRL